MSFLAFSAIIDVASAISLRHPARIKRRLQFTQAFVDVRVD